MLASRPEVESRWCAPSWKAARARLRPHRFNTTPKTVAKWVDRFEPEGVAGRPILETQLIAEPNPARHRRRGREIAPLAQDPGAHRRRARHLQGQRLPHPQTPRLSLLSSLEPQEPRPRYERKTPGEIIHIDIKKLARFKSIGHRITGYYGCNSSRGAGWEFVHVAIDDHSRIARADIFPDEGKDSAVAFLRATVAYYNSLGVSVERVMTDNGSCYRSKAFARACKQLRIKHIRTTPYTPQTNGKAERFIQSALREWAYTTAFEHSDQRRHALVPWLHRSNWHRPHASLANKPPISRLGLTGYNLLRLHT
jgi:transposase InsO family protein